MCAPTMALDYSEERIEKNLEKVDKIPEIIPKKNSKNLEKPAQNDSKAHFVRNCVLFAILGTINNLAYCIVLSAAKSLSAEFGEEKNYGVVGASVVGLSYLGPIFGSVCGKLRIKFVYRVLFGTVSLLAGLLTVAMASSFWVAIVGILFCGLTSAFGEATLLSYLRFFHGHTTAGWGFGTGFAGVFGALLYLILFSVVGLKNSTIFWILVPSSALYLVSFLLLKPTREVLYSHTELEEGSAEGAPKKARFLLSSWKAVGFVCVMLCSIYWLEYMCYSKFARDATALSEEEIGGKSDFMAWTTCNGYEIIQVLYQVGVLISRTSLPLLLRVPLLRGTYGIGWLTLCQLSMFVLWALDSLFRFLTIFPEFVFIVIVGLFGGSMYILSFHSLQCSPSFPPEEKETCIILAQGAMNSGILFQFLTVLLLDNTFWPPRDNEGCVLRYKS